MAWRSTASRPVTRNRSGTGKLPAGKIVNRWRGEKMDLGLGIEALMQRTSRAEDVPAGTSTPA